jgi:hypothetical protein
MVLDHLAAKCRSQAAQPFTPVLDLAETLVGKHSWQILTWLAYQLTATSWPQFGRLSLPRFALGRIIAEGAVVTESPERTERAIEDLLREAANLDRAARNVGDLVGQLPQLLGIGGWAATIGKLSTWVITSRLTVRLRFHTGMAFYGAVLSNRSNGGFPALVELSRLRAETGQAGQDTLNRVLCEAFLADIAECYEHGFRPRNCLILLDNVDDDSGRGRAFLTALAAAKTSRAEQARRAGRPLAGDPLLAVVASGQVEPLKPLLLDAGVQPAQQETWLRRDSGACRADWLTTRTNRASWLYPVRLTDLHRDDIAELIRDQATGGTEWAGLVHSLTCGHPWGVHHVVAALTGLRGGSARRLGERELRGVLDAHVPTYDPVLGDVAMEALLPDDLRVLPPGQLHTAAAALDVVAAGRPELVGRATLQNDLANRFWLVPGSVPARPTLHPWLRRLLLRGLANTRGPKWAEVFTALRARPADDPVAAAHYDVALGVFTDAVALLRDRFNLIDGSGELSADQWITEFDTITSAPRQHVTSPGAGHELDAVTAHEDLLSKQLAAFEVPPDEHGVTILILATARQLWSDPLCDPLLTLNPILGNGFRDLARRCAWGQLRFIEEADFYEHGGRPWPRRTGNGGS